MAWNDHRNLAGFICGFVLGKLSTALKWYSVKRKEMYTQVENAVFANFPFSYVPIKNCWIKKKNCWIKSYWIILPIPPCNLGIISVIPYGNLSISVYSGWKGFWLEKIRTVWNNISNAKKRFFCGNVCPQSFIPWPLSPRWCHLGNWVPRVNFLSLLEMCDIRLEEVILYFRMTLPLFEVGY